MTVTGQTAFLVRCTLEIGGGQYRCVTLSSTRNSSKQLYSQTSLESIRPGATVIPVILSTDKTQLTLFCGKSAYPVYLTIGNIPKHIRRKPSCHAQILIAYIPTTKLEAFTNQTGQRCVMANLYHFCMKFIVSLIKAYGETGIPMMSGDGVWCRCHPIYSVFVSDHLEQALVTCTHSNRCPKCLVPYDKLGSYSSFPPRNYDKARDVYLLSDGDAHTFHLACCEASQKCYIFLLPYYTQIRRTAFFPFSPILSQGFCTFTI